MSELIKEEQKIFTNVVNTIDNKIDSNNEKIKDCNNKRKSGNINTDAQGDIDGLKDTIVKCQDENKNLYEIRSELYKERFIVLADYGDGDIEELSMNVGLHQCTIDHDKIIYSWVKDPICKHFFLGNYDSYMHNGMAKFDIESRRKLELSGDKVKDVHIVYETNLNFEEKQKQKKLISDAFLLELLKRRGESEFSNIVFSIQEKQAQIITSPYGENMVVQGCAGSGKSMIMLHRLPIVLYDSEKNIHRRGVRVITPSEIYIQMARQLQHDLEIEDVPMSILKEYYYEKIRNYSNEYSEILKGRRIQTKLDKSIVLGIYSAEMVEKINLQIQKYLVKAHEMVRSISLELDAESSSTTPKQEIERICDQLNVLVNRKNSELSQLNKGKVNLVMAMQRLAKFLRSNSFDVKSKNQTRIDEIDRELAELHKLIMGLVSKHGDKATEYKRYQDAMKSIESKLQTKEELISLNESDELSNVQKKFDYIANSIDNVIKKCVQGKEELTIDYRTFFIDAVKQLTAVILSYEASFDLSEVKGVAERVEDNLDLWMRDEENGNFEDISNIKRIQKQLTNIRSSFVKMVYSDVISGIMRNYNLKEDIEYDFMPYILLQTIYIIEGPLKLNRDQMLIIDEAQNISHEEYKLLKEINGNVIFNIYGDILQHVDKERGINQWNELDDILDYKFYEMNQNYRNASQITDYCNEKFDTEMIPLPAALKGSGVYEHESQRESLISVINKIYRNKKPNYRMAVIVENNSIVSSTDIKGIHASVNKISSSNKRIDASKINVIGIDDVKGIEFDVVLFVNSNSFTKNECYIACTRALDELHIYNS